ncbi:prophage antirepressor-like protein [Pedobacter cryoconitis]|uniref:Prophage antirepressor-like protein n=1 Tax=Pedobacter cryoconitis TaxID=188932 RepID=A0A7W8ZSH3_9SPHI|nr:BRO family protein [Pedobacter cryoconitis]MBB5639047.1 prophage antirepressor-like protein [Pedobacter cryoconitis]
MSEIKLFEDTNIRAKWNEDEDKWYFVVQDVIAFLTDSTQPSKYWSALKKRTLNNDSIELSTICRQLKFTANDGKTYKYECADNEAIFRIIQSVASKKAEPFKRWLAKLGKERIEEIEQPQKAIDRAKGYYTAKGHTKEWVETRVSGIGTRNELTKQWQNSGVDGSEYGILTNELTSATFGMDTTQYRYHKNITKNDSLRDNMNPMELVITMLGEATAREISEKTNAKGLKGNKNAVLEAGKIASETIKNIEAKTNIKIVSTDNLKHLNNPETTKRIVASESKEITSGNKKLDSAIKFVLKKPKK